MRAASLKRPSRRRQKVRSQPSLCKQPARPPGHTRTFRGAEPAATQRLTHRGDGAGVEGARGARLQREAACPPSSAAAVLLRARLSASPSRPVGPPRSGPGRRRRCRRRQHRDARAAAPAVAASRLRPSPSLPQAVSGGWVGCISPGYIATLGLAGRGRECGTGRAASSRRQGGRRRGDRRGGERRSGGGTTSTGSARRRRARHRRLFCRRRAAGPAPPLAPRRWTRGSAPREVTREEEEDSEHVQNACLRCVTDLEYSERASRSEGATATQNLLPASSLEEGKLYPIHIFHRWRALKYLAGGLLGAPSVPKYMHRNISR